MSVLKELTETHETIKGLALNLLLIPFWYVSIFLFNKGFYVSADSIIIFAMCIVISLISSTLFTFVLTPVPEYKKDQKSFFEKMIISVAMLILWLSALIFVTYTQRFLFKRYIDFYWFLVIYFAPIIVFIIVKVLFTMKKTNKKPNG